MKHTLSLHVKAQNRNFVAASSLVTNLSEWTSAGNKMSSETQSTIPPATSAASQHRVISKPHPVKGSVVACSQSPNLSAGLDNLRLSGGEETRKCKWKEPAAASQQKSTPHSKPPSHQDNSKTCSNPKTPGNMPTKTSSNQAALHVSTGKFYLNKCDWCQKLNILCEI